jgi:hypothetical protein
MDVIAVGAAKPVVLTLHCANNTGADGFLTVVKVNEAKHLAPVIHFGAFVLKAPTQGHVSVQVQARVAINDRALRCHQIGETFGMGTGGGDTDGSGVHREVLTHDQLIQTQ